tara:strand:- start:10195 stop:10353 length:159 start_codon:yes stop_codon:yes gene_type:complete
MSCLSQFKKDVSTFGLPITGVSPTEVDQLPVEHKEQIHSSYYKIVVGQNNGS